MDYEAEYDNRARVPDHMVIMAGWERDAAAYRERDGAELDIRYGPSPRMVLDIFHASGGEAKRLVMFIHGGYWRTFDRSWFSHLAAGPNARGIAVAMPSYDLCPHVTVQRIIDEIREAAAFLHARFGRPIIACGHSAGGHLVGALLATDWQAVDPALPADLVTQGFSLSGLFDLTPIVLTSINKELKLDEAEARRVSPLAWPVPKGRRLEAWVGGEESAEYHRQSREMVRAWQDAGAAAAYRTVEGANHFTVIAPLTDPESAMTTTLVEMADTLRR